MTVAFRPRHWWRAHAAEFGVNIFGPVSVDMKVLTAGDAMVNKADDGQIHVTRTSNGAAREVHGSDLLAAGRQPNTEDLGLKHAGIEANEVVHLLLDAMAADVSYKLIQRAVHIHPTVSELIPTLLRTLKPLSEP